MARGNQGDPTDWVTRAADDAIRHAHDLYGEDPVTTSRLRRLSPSGPIHLGNLREFLTVHFVAEEIRRRGIAVRHLHSWDDYDRFRKVPAGIDPAFADHIGRPLSAVPDPWGCHASWAEHYKAPLQEALAELGVEMEEVSQTERYRAGAYRDEILTAVRRRDEIERVMAGYRTEGRAGRRVRAGGRRAGRLSRRRRRRPPWAPATSPGSRSSPTAASAAATRPRSRRTTTRPPSSPTPAGLRLRRTPPTSPTDADTEGQAGLEGRLADALGRRGRRLRARRGRPRHARVVVHRGQGARGAGLRRPRAVLVRLLVRRRRRPGEDVVVARRRPDRG